VDPPSESQGTTTEICRRCLERHVEGIESCMENAYSSRSRFYVPPAVTSTECPQTCTTTTTTSIGSGNCSSAPSSTSSLLKTSTVNHNHLTVQKGPYHLTVPGMKPRRRLSSPGTGTRQFRSTTTIYDGTSCRPVGLCPMLYYVDSGHKNS